MKFNKVREFFAILLTAILISGIVSFWNDPENYSQFIRWSTFIFVFYYLYTSVEENFLVQKADTQAEKLTKTVSLLAATAVFSALLAGIILDISRFDPCDGWAKSAEYCQIEKIKGPYHSVDPYEDY
ncbi:hypothetical protein GW943_00580 [Candidatus Parcubacteria bacterium]|uniref:Uncharacterized protein n=1 Tax=Candidatus Kaiserbacteria bacterium CG10_big_fil_rev_8_21_14_0_10_47_16 TaxID=1974608 RepID=A0A2H0UD74_9BACT|nr:hypothetical protein [Candidatus Parcubacteria bacterium]PIR84337.1 MAG: hypothetical protein COU16_01960 [Candidatus Kaiserbacteria bacterium CG10_big_fil_rev_8_21_14_0_10_47_16]